MFRGYFRSFPVQTRRTEPPRGEGEEVSAPCSQSLAVSTISGWEPGQATLPTPTRRDASSSAFLPASCCALSFLPPPSDGDATSDPHRSAGPSFWGQSRGLCPFLKQRRNQQSSTFAIGHPETKGWNSWLNQPTTVGLQALQVLQRINPTQTERGRKRK